MSERNFPGSLAIRAAGLAILIGLLLCSTFVLSQSTVGTGSIVGTVTDQSGAVVGGAKVTIANQATGQNLDLTTNSAGGFNSGPITPGNYKVSVSSKGFSTLTTNAAVLVGNTSTVNARLQLGQETQTIEVQAAELQVNTEQATVQGVLNSSQIENFR